MTIEIVKGGRVMSPRTQFRWLEGTAWEQCREAWNHCVASSREPCGFVTHEWLSSWLEAFGDQAQPRIASLWSGHRMLAGLPLLFGRHRKLYGVRFCTVEFMTHDETPRVAGFVRDGEEWALTRVLEEALSENVEWDLWWLRDIPEGDAIEDALTHVTRERRLTLHSRPSRMSPFIPIEESWESFSIKRKFPSKSTRRRHRKLAKLGPVRLRGWNGEAREDLINDVYEVCDHSWAARQGTAVNSTARTKRFWESAARRCQGDVQLIPYLIDIDSRPISFQFVLKYRKQAYTLKCGYDERFAQYSPGTLLALEYLPRLFDEGVEEIDLGGTADEWKRKLTDRDRLSRDWLLWKSGIRSSYFEMMDLVLKPWFTRAPALKGLKSRLGAFRLTSEAEPLGNEKEI